MRLSSALLAPLALATVALGGCGGSGNTTVPPPAGHPNAEAPAPLVHALGNTYSRPLSARVREVVSSSGKSATVSLVTQQESPSESYTILSVTGPKGAVTERFLYRGGVALISTEGGKWYRLEGALAISGQQVRREDGFLSDADELRDISVASQEGATISYAAKFSPDAMKRVLEATEGTEEAQEVSLRGSSLLITVSPKEGLMRSLQGTMSLSARGRPLSLSISSTYTPLAKAAIPAAVPAGAISSTQQLAAIVEAQKSAH